jgi:hypothetical protein
VKERITGVIVKLAVGGAPCLFVMLGADGAVHRMGSGAAGNTDFDHHVGTAPEPLFQAFMGRISEELFTHAGRYRMPGAEGAPCELVVLFRRDDGGTIAFQFEYGAESAGPPEDVLDLVEAATSVTGAWWTARKAAR